MNMLPGDLRQYTLRIVRAFKLNSKADSHTNLLISSFHCLLKLGHPLIYFKKSKNPSHISSWATQPNPIKIDTKGAIKSVRIEGQITIL